MNDFTKEELQLLYGGMNYAINNYIGLAINPAIPLLNKIQSLIDNYCEHEWREDFSNVTAETCLECGKSRIM